MKNIHLTIFYTPPPPPGNSRFSSPQYWKRGGPGLGVPGGVNGKISSKTWNMAKYIEYPTYWTLSRFYQCNHWGRLSDILDWGRLSAILDWGRLSAILDWGRLSAILDWGRLFAILPNQTQGE